MPKQQTLKTTKDNKWVRISAKKKTKWKMVGKKGKLAVIESEGGSTRFMPLSTKVFSLV